MPTGLLNPTMIRNLIREDKIHQIYSTMQTGQDKFGMQTFNQSLATLYFKKQITLELALARSSNPDELQDLINRGAGLLQTSVTPLPGQYPTGRGPGAGQPGKPIAPLGRVGR